MTDEQIERGLERMATCRCPDVTNFDYGEALNYINRLKAENAKLQEWKRRQQICNETNTERILQLEDEKKEIRKETAKEILTTLKAWGDRETPLTVDIQELAQKYGVEVNK